MGRGSRRSSAGDVPGDVDPPSEYPVVIADEAMTELVDLLTHISKDSPKNAASVRAAVEKRLDRLQRFPRTGHADPNAPLVPPGAGAYIVTVKNVSMYYLFPLGWRSREIVYVVTIRQGSRMPLEEPQYLARWMEELAMLAPPPDKPSQDYGVLKLGRSTDRAVETLRGKPDAV